MIDRRKTDRRVCIDRRIGSDRRTSDREETEWLPPYGRRKLDTSDSRKNERRRICRRIEN